MTSQIRNNNSAEIMQGDNTANNHHDRCYSQANRHHDNLAGIETKTDQNDAKKSHQNKKHHNKHVRLSFAYSVYSAFICAFTGFTGILVFGTIYILVRIFLTWGLKQNNQHLQENPKILNEAIQTRLPLSIIAGILGICSYRLSAYPPSLAALTVTLSEAALIAVAMSALMSGIGDTIALFLHHPAQQDRRAAR